MRAELADDVLLHDLDSDVDLNRTVCAFSASPDRVLGKLRRLAGLVLPSIDLTRHVGSHPRLGALDLCTLAAIEEGGEEEAAAIGRVMADWLASEHGVAVFFGPGLAEEARETRLAAMRERGFGTLLGREIQPDVGPDRADPRLGLSFVSVVPLVPKVALRLHTLDIEGTRSLVNFAEDRRLEGEARLSGIDLAAYPLASRGQVRLEVTVGLPEVASVDSALAWLLTEIGRRRWRVAENRVVGAIRPRHAQRATRTRVRSEQIV